MPYPLSRLFSPKPEHSDTCGGSGPPLWTSLPNACPGCEELRKQRQLWFHTGQYKTQLFGETKNGTSVLEAQTKDVSIFSWRLGGQLHMQAVCALVELQFRVAP